MPRRACREPSRLCTDRHDADRGERSVGTLHVPVIHPNAMTQTNGRPVTQNPVHYRVDCGRAALGRGKYHLIGPSEGLERSALIESRFDVLLMDATISETDPQP